jgi:hypothetical protein
MLHIWYHKTDNIKLVLLNIQKSSVNTSELKLNQ